VWDKRNSYSIFFVRRHEGNKQLGRCKCRWSGGAIVVIQEIHFEYELISVVKETVELHLYYLWAFVACSRVNFTFYYCGSV
jgi:hypothetical protein